MTSPVLRWSQRPDSWSCASHAWMARDERDWARSGEELEEDCGEGESAPGGSIYWVGTKTRRIGARLRMVAWRREWIEGAKGGLKLGIRWD